MFQGNYEISFILHFEVNYLIYKEHLRRELRQNGKVGFSAQPDQNCFVINLVCKQDWGYI